MKNTISAVSTPRGRGGVALIRVSGDEAFSVALGMFLPKFYKISDPAHLDSSLLRRAIYGTVLSADGEPIDEGILTLYKGPRSFTGEDMAEISCHGGVAVTEEVFLSSLAHGARTAGPGEFTRRAFLSGKLSLTEAEAVGLLIDADTGEGVRLAAGAARGNVSREIDEIAAPLCDVMTALYAAIDYPEEDVGDEGERRIEAVLSSSLGKAERLLSSYKLGRAVSSGVSCCICGRPNVGKSSLFNRISGAESAIVTDIAGTTRDVLRERVSFGGITLNIADTAGLRESGDVVERYGIERAERELSSAELIFAVFDGSCAFTPEDEKFAGMVLSSGGMAIAVLNKADRGLEESCARCVRELFGEYYAVSAERGDGIDELSAAVGRLYGSGELSLSGDAVIWDERQREILYHCREALSSALGGIRDGAPLDWVCTEVEEALSYLRETDGRGVSEEIINEVFKRFCVGK